jgi:hypothetical protein
LEAEVAEACGLKQIFLDEQGVPVPLINEETKK